MTITGKIIRNVSFSWAYYFIQLAVGFFLMPFMVHRLGVEVYGLWILVFSFMAYTVFFEFGIRGSVIKYVSEFEAKKDFESLNKVVNTSWIIHSIMGLTVALFFFVLSYFLSYFFKVSPFLLNDFKICFRIMGLSVGFALFFMIFAGILEGHKRTDIISIIEAIFFIIQNLLIVFSVLKGYGIVSLAFIIFGVNIFRHLTRLILSFKIYPRLRLNIFDFNKKTLKLIFNYSFFLFILQGLLSFLNTLPNIILGISLGPISITFYSIAARLIGYLQTILFTTSGVLVPFVSSFDALKDKERIRKSFILGSRYSYGIVLFLSLVLIVMGKPFLKLWMGEEFAYKSYNVLLIVTMPLVFSPSFFTIHALLKGLGRLKEITIFTMFQVLLSVILSIVFIKNLKLLGVALGFSIPYFLNYGIILPVLALRILGIRFNDYINNVFVKSMIPAAILFIILIILKNSYYPSNYIVLISEILFSGLVYLSIYFRWVLGNYERNFYISKVKLCFKNT